MSIIRLTLLALLACVPLLAQAAPYQLTTAWPVNVGPLNPHLYTPNQMFAQSMVYEPLVKYQADGSVQPWLATRWRHSADGKTWWFTLRDDVAFSNGEPFNAQAAAANFQAVLANRQRHAWLELANQITDVRAPQRHRAADHPEKRLRPLTARAGPAPPVPLHRPLAVYRWRHRQGH